MVIFWQFFGRPMRLLRCRLVWNIKRSDPTIGSGLLASQYRKWIFFWTTAEKIMIGEHRTEYPALLRWGSSFPSDAALRGNHWSLCLDVKAMGGRNGEGEWRHDSHNFVYWRCQISLPLHQLLLVEGKGNLKARRWPSLKRNKPEIKKGAWDSVDGAGQSVGAAFLFCTTMHYRTT